MGGGPLHERRRLWLSLPRPLPLAGGEEEEGGVDVDPGTRGQARPLPQAGRGWGEGLSTSGVACGFPSPDPSRLREGRKKRAALMSIQALAAKHAPSRRREGDGGRGLSTGGVACGFSLPRPLPLAGGEEEEGGVDVDPGTRGQARPLPQAGGGWGEGLSTSGVACGFPSPDPSRLREGRKKRAALMSIQALAAKHAPSRRREGDGGGLSTSGVACGAPSPGPSRLREGRKKRAALMSIQSLAAKRTPSRRREGDGGRGLSMSGVACGFPSPNPSRLREGRRSEQTGKRAGDRSPAPLFRTVKPGL
ncbi:hypothetical protein QE379_000991 [Sphingomonas sp. SORGH_AS 879]|nr:hypothetical protein [Sphingomonas sp. SORGH_AS_0879]